jgi:hypothetical protein
MFGCNAERNLENTLGVQNSSLRDISNYVEIQDVWNQTYIFDVLASTCLVL